MPERRTESVPFPTTRQDERRPAVTVDLFGDAVPIRPAKGRSRPAAEWPAAAEARPSTPPPAGDRPPAPPPGSGLAGDYARTGANLRRVDGRSLVVCLSKKRALGPRDAARYVQTVAPGEAIRYAGNLYQNCDGADDLDGAEFQDRLTRTRYAIRRTAPDRYLVEPTRSRRGRSDR